MAGVLALALAGCGNAPEDPPVPAASSSTAAAPAAIVQPPDLHARFDQALSDRVDREEQAAAAAQAKHAYRSAFDHYVEAIRLMGTTSTVVVANKDQPFENDLAHVAAILPKLKPAPAIPETAQTHSDRAIAILQSARSDTDNDQAASEFGLAVLEAPWVADLYRDYGLVLAKTGNAGGASINLNRYLILNPKARDAAAVRQKIAELQPLADEQKLWLRFTTGTRTLESGGVHQLILRGRNLVVVLVKPSSTDSVWHAGEVLCSGTISNTRFQGQCEYSDSNPKFLACFGNKPMFPADGSIAGDIFTIQGVNEIEYVAKSCVIGSETRATVLTYRASQN